jgi:hypothetical protein
MRTPGDVVDLRAGARRTWRITAGAQTFVLIVGRDEALDPVCVSTMWMEVRLGIHHVLSRERDLLKEIVACGADQTAQMTLSTRRH